jgi:hypothetical protein
MEKSIYSDKQKWNQQSDGNLLGCISLNKQIKYQRKHSRDDALTEAIESSFML